MANSTNDVLINGFSNVTKEGVILHLNKKTSLKTANVKSNEFFVSWDKIGNLLFDNYCDSYDLEYLRELRGEK